MPHNPAASPNNNFGLPYSVFQELIKEKDNKLIDHIGRYINNKENSYYRYLWGTLVNYCKRQGVPPMNIQNVVQTGVNGAILGFWKKMSHEALYYDNLNNVFITRCIDVIRADVGIRKKKVENLTGYLDIQTMTTHFVNKATDENVLADIIKLEEIKEEQDEETDFIQQIWQVDKLNTKVSKAASKAWHLLKEDCQKALAYRFCTDLDSEESAEKLDIQTLTFNTRVNRCKEYFKKAYDKILPFQ